MDCGTNTIRTYSWFRKAHRGYGTVFPTWIFGTSHRRWFAPIDENVAKQIFNLHFGRLQRTTDETEKHPVEFVGWSIATSGKQRGILPNTARPIAGVARTYIKVRISSDCLWANRAGDNIVINYRERWTDMGTMLAQRALGKHPTKSDNKFCREIFFMMNFNLFLTKRLLDILWLIAMVWTVVKSEMY